MDLEAEKKALKRLGPRRYAYFLLEPWSSDRDFSLLLDAVITVVILINIAALTIQTVANLPDYVYDVINWIEIGSIIFFTVEYLTRIWVAVEDETLQQYRFPRLRFMARPFAVIDLLAVLPFYLLLITGLNVKVLLILRLFRLLKLVRYFRALQLMLNVFRSKSQELLIALFFTLTILLFVSFLMYYVEGPHQPEVFGSVPETFWWGIVTLTTVGYGDVVPITPMGKFFGGCIAILGIGIFALPAGILASGFSEELKRVTESKKSTDDENSIMCPHCGGNITEDMMHKHD